MAFYLSTEQVAIMFILMAVGAISYKFHFIHADTAKDMTNLLLYIVMPCLIIHAFQEPFSKQRLRVMILLFLFVCVSFILSILIGKLCFNKRTVKDDEKNIVLQFGTVYSNAGFMGIPLAGALFGSDGVFFAVPYLAGYTLFIWTHGIAGFQKSADRNLKRSIKKVVLNPNTLATIIAFIIYVFSIQLPSILSDSVNNIAAINTPLSMIVIGSTIAGIQLRTILNEKMVWIGSLVRNLIVPLIIIALFKFVPVSTTASTVTIIMASCPVAGLAVLFSVLNNRDAIFPTKLMCASTLMSIFTLPAIMFIASLIL